jgi:hypothetical protein
VLLARDLAAHASLDNPDGVARLLNSLRAAGANEQAAALASQLPAVGMFGLFLEQQGPADQFRFGRKADGTPAAPWEWKDLDLWLVPDRTRRWIVIIWPGCQGRSMWAVSKELLNGGTGGNITGSGSITIPPPTKIGVTGMRAPRQSNVE